MTPTRPMRQSSWAFFLALCRFALKPILAHDWFRPLSAIRSPQLSFCGQRTADKQPVFRSHSGMIPTRGPHMKRFRLATWATLAGLMLVAGCASPCGPTLWQRFQAFRARGTCPCESGAGVPVTGEGPILGDSGPYLGEPPGTMVPSGTPGGMVPSATPGPLPTFPTQPGIPSVPPPDGGRLIPNPAQTAPTLPSSRPRSRT